MDIDIVEIICGDCGCYSALSRLHFKGLESIHETFYCPNGHLRHFGGESDSERAARHQRNYNRELFASETLERANQSLKTQVKNLKKKVAGK